MRYVTLDYFRRCSFYRNARGQIVYLVCILTILSSCSTLKTECLHYQSIRKTYRYDNTENAKIVVAAELSADGVLGIGVQNNTGEIMTIDMVKSFVVTTSGKSLSFYDPTVRVESTTASSSTSNGGSLNLGSVASVLGIGGVVGTLANGINVGGSNTNGVSTTNTTYLSDMPQVSLAPHSVGTMPKVFNVGTIRDKSYTNVPYREISREDAKKFALVIRWSVDDGKTFETYEQWYYINADFTVPVRSHGQLNAALREILTSKNDCIHEPWWIIYTQNNYEDDCIMLKKNLSVDYQ